MTEEMTPDTPEEDQEQLKYPLPESGPLTLEAIREKYASVEEAVRDKDHLMRGVVSHDFQMGATTFRLRTLRRREQDALASDKIAGTPEDDLSQFLRNQMYTLALAIERVDETAWVTPKLGVSTVDAWRDHESVTSKIEFLEDWDGTLVEILLRIQKELELVKAIFLRENLKNL